MIIVKFKIIEQDKYENFIELTLDKELPIGWFGRTIMIDGKETSFKRGFMADYIEVQEEGNYVGKICEIDDKQIKRSFREK